MLLRCFSHEVKSGMWSRGASSFENGNIGVIINLGGNDFLLMMVTRNHDAVRRQNVDIGDLGLLP